MNFLSQKTFLLSLSRKFLKKVSKVRSSIPVLSYVTPSSSHFSHTLEAVIDLRKKYVFILNPKVGSRSIANLLSRFDSVFVIYLSPKLAKDFKDGGFSFYSFIRDPIDRVLSCYRQKFNTSDLNIKKSHSKLGIKNELSLKEFIQFISGKSKDDSISDKHWASQEYLLQINRTLKIDEFNLLDFGNFDKELVKFVQKKYNVYVEVPHLLATSQSHNTLSKEDVELLYKRYKSDFRLFERIKK